MIDVQVSQRLTTEVADRCSEDCELWALEMLNVEVTGTWVG